MFWYRTGTVTLVNGSNVANFTGASLNGEVKPGEILLVNGVLIEIERVLTNTSLRLATNWIVANQTNQPFAIIRNIVGASNFDLMKKIEEFLTDRQRSMDEFVDWVTGDYNKGPTNNGQFPLTDRYGVVVYAPSPERLKWESDQLVASLDSTLDAATIQLAALGDQTTWANQILGYKNAAAASATLASQWADNNENVAVTTGKYSAKHHAIKAAASQTDVTTRQNDVISRQTTITNIQTDVTTKQTDVTAKQADVITRQNDVITRQSDVTSKQTSAAGSATTATTKAAEAATSATNAAASNATAQKWAEEAEDVQVTSGKYSAKHWSEKSADSATAAASSATAAASSATAAATSATNAATSKTGADTAKTGADTAKTGAETAKGGAETARNAAQAAQAAAEQARDIAVSAAGSVTGGLVDLGQVNLSGGAYPTKPTTYSSFWKVTTGGTVSGTEYGVGDTLVYSKTLDSWYKIDNTEAVTSVAGKSGVVTLVASDVGAVPVTGGTMTGNLHIINNSASAAIEIGRVDAANTPYIDFHSSGNNIDHDARIAVSGGTTSSGNAAMGFTAGSFSFNTGIISGNGANLTSLNASNLASGTVPTARLDAKLQSLIGLTGAADKLPYFTGATSMAVADLAPFMRTRLGDTSLLNFRRAISAPVYATNYRVGDEFKHRYDQTATVTGCLKITLPTLPAGTTKNTMLGMRIRLYEYSARGISYVTLGGYLSEAAGVKTWYNTNKKVDSGVVPGPMREVTDVKFGVEDGKFVILIGKSATLTDSTWSYPAVSFEKVVAEYTGAGDDTIWNDESLWTIEYVTDVTGITIHEPSTATLNGWHSGNFDPDTKQNALGYNPVQQGTGAGQTGSVVKIGWSAGGLLLTVDSTDFANNWPISISKNAATATKLQTARTINGTAFDGSANITVSDDTKVPLTGTTFASTVNMNYNSAGGIADATTYKTSLTVMGPSAGGPNGAFLTFHRAGAHASYFGVDTDSKLKWGGWTLGANAYEIFHDNNASSKNVGSATKLATARAINGVNFDGTAAITVADGTKLPLIGGVMTGPIYYEADNYSTAWARGFWFNDGGSMAGSIGAYGAAADTFTSVYMGVGTSPWSTGIAIRISAATGIEMEGTARSKGVMIGSFEAGTTPTYAQAQLRAESSGTNPAAIGFHRPGFTAATLVHKSNGLELHSSAWNVYADFKCASLDLTGDLTIQKGNPWIALDSASTGGDGTDQGAGISLGESGYKGAASLHLTYTGNGQGHIGMGAVDPTSALPQYEALRFFYTDNKTRVMGDLEMTGNGKMILAGGALLTAVAPAYAVQMTSAYGATTIGMLNSVYSHYATAASNGHYFYGDIVSSASIIATGNVTAYSDITLKTDIQVIPNALDKVCQINGVTYERVDITCGRQAGVIAQEVEKVLPEVVVKTATGEGEEILSVNYNGMVGLLIEAVKDLKAELDSVKAELAALKAGV